MAAIEVALAEIDGLILGKDFTYSEIARKYSIARSTLSRRHQGTCALYTTKKQQQAKLSPHEEQELVQYIEQLTKRHIPPTRNMIQNFASRIAKNTVSKSWVTRFINRNSIKLISQ